MSERRLYVFKGAEMKSIIVSTALAVVLLLSLDSFSQDTTFKFIFVPHVRSEDAVNQTVNPGIAKIDFSKYSLKMLGGDLAQQTSKSRTTMKYEDSLFDIKNPNTLWSIGNHDIESGDSNLIKEFTGRQLYYSYYRDGITFLVLNTEANAEAFNRTFIKGPQLDTVKAVCARITSAETKFLIVLHSRYMWMINNPYFTQKMKDSIAASSKSMDTTNFYSDIYPLLKQVRAKGIQVLVFGGDKSQINVTYTYNQADSIKFFAARMENTFADSVNNVIILTYVKNKRITTNYVTLNKVNQATPVFPQAVPATRSGLNRENLIAIRNGCGSGEMTIVRQKGPIGPGLVQLYSMNGALLQSVGLLVNERRSFRVGKPGMYILKASSGNAHQVSKVIVQ
jgi:hypothetical protein